jgi:hypothetical protein
MQPTITALTINQRRTAHNILLGKAHITTADRHTRNMLAQGLAAATPTGRIHPTPTLLARYATPCPDISTPMATLLTTINTNHDWCTALHGHARATFAALAARNLISRDTNGNFNPTPTGHNVLRCLDLINSQNPRHPDCPDCGINHTDHPSAAGTTPTGRYAYTPMPETHLPLPQTGTLAIPINKTTCRCGHWHTWHGHHTHHQHHTTNRPTHAYTITFGPNHTHPNGTPLAKRFCEIHAPSDIHARCLAFNKFSGNWAFMYPTRTAAGVDKYHLTGITPPPSTGNYTVDSQTDTIVLIRP